MNSRVCGNPGGNLNKKMEFPTFTHESLTWMEKVQTRIKSFMTLLVLIDFIVII